MANDSLRTVSSSSDLIRPARVPANVLDRFDALVSGVILTLLAVIVVVIAHGDHANGAQAIPVSVVYVGPMDAQLQNLWRVDPGGITPPQQLTNAVHGILDYDVSRDGLIVYGDQTATGGAKLMLLDPATGRISLLYDCPDATCDEVAWRPDGKAVAFDHSALNTGSNLPPGAPRVWIYDLTAGKASSLFADSQRLGYMPRWSPDGKKLALFDADVGGTGGIVVHDFNTNTDVTIAAPQGQVGTFSPDGRYLWFPKVLQIADGQFITHLSVIDLSSHPPLQHDLTPDTQDDDDADPIWLPDSRTLIVLRIPGDRLDTQERQIYRVDVATGKATPILDEPGYTHSNLSLNITGDQLVYQRLQLGTGVTRPEIWVYNLKTNTAHKLADDGNVPRWLP
ncbi:MAG: TolB family protein [Aggregatilineales bacterium]